MSQINIQDALNPILLHYYAQEVARGSFAIKNLNDDVIFQNTDCSGLHQESGIHTYPIQLNNETLANLICNFSEAQGQFFKQFIEECLRSHEDKENYEFDAAYLKNTLSILENIMRKIATNFDLKSVSEFCLKECQKLFGVESGSLYFIENGKLNLISLCGQQVTEEEKSVIHFSCFSNQVILSNQPEDDPRFQSQMPSDDSEKIIQPTKLAQNFLVIPLLREKKVLGALAIKNKVTGPFERQDVSLAHSFATLVASTISSILAHKNLMEQQQIRANLERYLSPNLAEEITRHGGYKEKTGKNVPATIFFSDIRGFTLHCAKYPAHIFVPQLNEYFEQMTEIVFKYEGTLDKFVGDLMMVLFGVPRSQDDGCIRAVKMAIEMQATLKTLNLKWKTQGLPALEVGMGINHGDVIFGNIGSPKAMGLTAIGDHVNQAQRLESHAKGGEILLSASVKEKIEAMGYYCADLGEIETKHCTLRAYSLQYSIHNNTSFTTNQTRDTA